MELEELREQINGIDEEILSLFTRRMSLAGQVARYKQEHGLPIFQQERERQILRRVGEKAGEFSGSAQVLFTTLMDVSKSYQRQILAHTDRSELRRRIEAAVAAGRRVPEEADVACAGVPGAYAHEAVLALFKRPALRFCERFDGVFAAVAGGEADFGVVPIENSIAGSVDAVYDLLRQYKLTICGSYKLPVDHCLLACSGADAGAITDVYSHEQAISQCSQFLSGHPGIRAHVDTTTAAAAKRVAEMNSPRAAAIASRACAEYYGLRIVREGLQNVRPNFTRFLVISKELIIPPDANKISLSLTLPHETGSLGRILTRFSSLSLNLTKLESRPRPDTDFEFRFYFDFDGSVREDAVRDLICSLEEETGQFEFLGNYT